MSSETSKIVPKYIFHKNFTYDRDRLTSAFGHNATAVGWVDDPVVVLDCVQSLYDRAHAPNVTVDLSVIDELIRQICVQSTLHL